MKKLGILLAISLFLAACTSTPVHNVKSASVPSNLTLDRVEQAVLKGLSVKGWQIKEKSDGKIIGQVFVRSHRAEVEITYNESEYSITYHDSHNLDFKPSNNTIHKNYNKWVILLDREIHKALSFKGFN